MPFKTTFVLKAVVFTAIAALNKAKKLSRTMRFFVFPLEFVFAKSSLTVLASADSLDGDRGIDEDWGDSETGRNFVPSYTTNSE